MNEQHPFSFNLNRRDFLVAGTAFGAVFQKQNSAQSTEAIPNLTGLNIVITGGNTGLGKSSAIKLARMGATVCIACRDKKRASKAVEEIKLNSNSQLVSWALLDLASMNSIELCAKDLKNRFEKIDVLQNNAGVMGLPKRKTTIDGFEYQFGVNHLGHFYLTNLLMEKILAAPKSRIVTVSSVAHAFPPGIINFSDIMGEKNYQPMVAYGQSKLANILFTKELQKRLDRKRIDTVTAVCCHPGIVATELFRNLDIATVKTLVLLSSELNRENPQLLPKVPSFLTSETGSLTQTFLCSDASVDKIGGGRYFDSCAEKEPSAQAQDMETAQRLWELSESLTANFKV